VTSHFPRRRRSGLITSRKSRWPPIAPLRLPQFVEKPSHALLFDLVLLPEPSRGLLAEELYLLGQFIGRFGGQLGLEFRRSPPCRLFAGPKLERDTGLIPDDQAEAAPIGIIWVHPRGVEPGCLEGLVRVPTVIQ